MMPLNSSLLALEKPSRYLGIEGNARKKDPEKTRVAFCLAFPDVYEIGMSHLGLQILYGLLNDIPRVAAERCFAPWTDMEEYLRLNHLPLTSLESKRPLASFDVIGFSLQYELSYTNVLNMLALGGIPWRSESRTDRHPLVIAGGPCAYNPAPMEDFIDAFVIGEGEEVALEIALAIIAGKKDRLNRRDLLVRLSEIRGVYVPADGREKIIRKRTIADFDTAYFPGQPVVPLMKTIHDRAILEIARGCTRGCRFCQAGMVWRPVRERGVSTLLKMGEEILCNTGYDELSLLSLSSGDYSRIELLLETLMERYLRKKIAVGLPSLRVETLSQKIMENIKRVRMTSFTLAPEAGTKRLRDIINKGNSEDDLLKTAEQVFQTGWKAIKLYFMIGLPGEEKEDLEGLVDLTYRVLKTGKGRGQITLGLSTFIPKPHTPFQWERQISIAETKDKQAYLTRHIRGRNLTVKWQDPRMSLLEGIFSRGDAPLGRLIERAYLLGCRFDGWSDQIQFNLWEEAIRAEAINLDHYLGERSLTLAHPWQAIDCGLTQKFLLKERENSFRGLLTGDCRFGDCQSCGVCGKEINGPVLSSAFEAQTAVEGKDEINRPARRYRTKFQKIGPARILSHLEISGALIRAFRRAGLTFIFSQGFHPHPKISFAHATAVGMESLSEYADIELEEPKEEAGNLISRMNSFLPAGLLIESLEEIDAQGPSLTQLISGFAYEIVLPGNGEATSLACLEEKVKGFLQAEVFHVFKKVDGKSTGKDIRPLVTSLRIEQENRLLSLMVKWGHQGSVRPWDILTQVLGLTDEMARQALIRKKDTIFKQPDAKFTIL